MYYIMIKYEFEHTNREIFEAKRTISVVGRCVYMMCSAVNLTRTRGEASSPNDGSAELRADQQKRATRDKAQPPCTVLSIAKASP
jgi:hypothetical protein